MAQMIMRTYLGQNPKAEWETQKEQRIRRDEKLEMNITLFLWYYLNFNFCDHVNCNDEGYFKFLVSVRVYLLSVL